MNRNEKMRIADCGLRIVSEFGLRNSDCGITVKQCCALPFRNPQSAIRIPHSPRRGILLLVVLSMLTLFLLIGTAFIVSANHFRRSMKIQAGVTQTSNSSIDQGLLLDEVINQLVRDTNNQNSSLRFHSLLRDMYGNDGILAEVTGSNWAGASQALTGGQMLQFQLYLNAGTPSDPRNPKDLSSIPVTLSSLDNAYNGLVLTFLNGPARGQSTRIVGYVGTTALFRVMTAPEADGSTLTPGDLNGSRIAINGRPFNGTGVGYDVGAVAGNARLTTTEGVFGTARPLSLLPNSSFQSLLLDTGSYSDQEISDLRASISDDYYFSSFTTARLTALGINGNSKAENLEAIRLKNLIGTPGQGGSDESYDAVDFQNMALALMPSDPVETTITAGATFPLAPRPTGLGGMVLPSLHRPALINYWESTLAGGGNPLPTNPSMLRKVLLRPSWWDHPEFTGSNPDYATQAADFRTEFDANPASAATANASSSLIDRMIYGPWDVDNDNDGVRDSVWVDFGAPVRENSDGKLVKPLAAILVLDMDGRLNINAHGSRDIARMNGLLPGQSIAGGANTNDLPRGQGYGPAEISLEPLMDLEPAGGLTPAQILARRRAWYQRFFAGVAASDTLMPTDTSSRVIARRRVGKMGGVDVVPGRLGFDLAAQVKMQGMPLRADRQASSTEISGNYVTPPDLKGRYAIPALNELGQPVYEVLNDVSPPGATDAEIAARDAARLLNTNSPYELDLSLGAARGENSSADDAPYSMAEMERILRAYDPDAGTLPSRIWEFAGEFKPTATATTPNLDNLNRWRASLTTDSYDLPVPNVVVPGWMRANFQTVMGRPPVGVSFADLLEYRLRVGGATDVRGEMRKLLPSDLADGLRLDINRPFGNGRDDDNVGDPGYGVVDEPGEVEGSYWASGDTRLSAFTGANGNFRDEIDRDGDETVDPVPTDLVLLHNLRRQMLARDLYVLALTLVDPFDLTTTAGKEKTRKLAQWAINVVDFRDPDNIMTAFEYDENPFDGWGVDGDLSSTSVDNTAPQRGLVWGSERPELLITETLAWHDRRTEDTKFENNPVPPEDAKQVGQQPEDDTDFDQQMRPQGVGFVELYSPGEDNPATNMDIHAIDTASGEVSVDLARTHDTTPTGSPVWRLNVYKTVNLDVASHIGGPHLDPDAEVAANRALGADRSVYFTGSDPGYLDDGVAYFNDLTENPVLPIRPGTYMVVGTGRKLSANRYFAPFGTVENQDPEKETKRGILLSTVAGANAVEVRGADGTIVDEPTTGLGVGGVFASQEYARVAIINKTATGTVQFSFSEPAGGYFVGGAQFAGGNVDVPLDDQRGGALGGGGGGAFNELDSKSRDKETRLMLPLQERVRRTVPGFSWVYLQRLANPSFPWNPEAGKVGHDPAKPQINPYLTLDSMGVNVTVFNGMSEELRKDPSGGAPLNFDNDSDSMGGGAADTFASLQRGRRNAQVVDALASPKRVAVGTNELTLMQKNFRDEDNERITSPMDPTLVGTQSQANLWGSEIVGRAPDDAGNDVNFGVWRNQAGPGTGGALPNGKEPGSNIYSLPVVPDCTLGFLNEPFRAAGAVGERETKREPAQPFPWITWNNRPFANAGELMLVPAFRSSQLLQAFSTSTSNPNYNKDDPTFEVQLSSTLTLETDGLFGHLLNFFRTEPSTVLGKEGIAGLHRMLDYVHVPSRFVGTETWLNPASFGNSNVTGVDDPRYLRQPPFNRISSFRDPGRVNLNTMLNETVYEGLMHGVTDSTVSGTIHPGPAEPLLIDSRRGHSLVDSPALTLEPNNPTFFANPFRSADSADLVPLTDMLRTSVDCTVIRSQNGMSGAAAQASGDPLFAAGTGEDYRDSFRNAYFDYQPMTRLSSMTTTRSNVYAVWVTVGFFEVEEADDWVTDENNVQARFNGNRALYDKVYPEGYQFGEEAGSETGDIRRVREFAMIDRTVPVAFQPGKNHNVDKAIRLRRRIE